MWPAWIFNYQATSLLLSLIQLIGVLIVFNDIMGIDTGMHKTNPLSLLTINYPILNTAYIKQQNADELSGLSLIAELVFQCKAG